MDIEQRTTILNMLFPMNRFNAYELRELEIEKKAVLLVQERARERKVTQPEEQPQPEEIAA